MPFVLDASVVLSWALADEEHPVATLALERIRTDAAYVPALWWFEVRNALIVNERRSRLDERETIEFLALLSAFTLTVDRDPDEATILALARKHRLTVYDAAYLELAKRLKMPLATLDDQLASAATAEQLAIICPPD